MQSIQAKLAEERLSPFVRVTLRVWIKGALALLAVARPVFDVVVRIELAQTMLRASFTMMMTHSTWAATEAIIGLIAPFLLMAGLATRVSATALALLICAGWRGATLDAGSLVLLALLGWYALRGAGAVSIDRAIARGLGDSALPLAAPVTRMLAWVSRQLAPLWLTAMRLWLAATLLAAGGWITPDTHVLPIGLFGLAVQALVLPLAVLIALGLAMPLTMLLVFLNLGTAMVMDGHVGLLLLPTMVLGLLAFEGAGTLSLDALSRRWLDRNVLFDRRFEDVPAHWPHVVVVGAGFGGVAAVNRLKRLPVRVTLIDRNNYHLFQPLLYQIATAALSPADVATPIRSLFAADGNVRVLLGTVEAIDPAAKVVTLACGTIAYDTLLLATGATHSYFGRDEWAAFAPGLKTIEDGTAIRARVLTAFERAEASDNPADAARLLTFVIVGAGPTGVELAGAIAELAHQGLRREYRNIDPSRARIVLVQSGPRVLPSFPEALSAQAAAALTRLGVEILLDSRVTGIDGCGVKLASGQTIATQTVLWGAGVVASPAARWLRCETDRSGRVVVDGQLRVAGFADVYAIGDTAASSGWNGKPVPGLAPAAKQAGEHFAKAVEQALLGRQAAPFAYKHQGSLATIGRKSAVADFGWIRLSGAPAWWLWGAVHVGFLAGFRNRVAVLVNWGWSYFTMRPGIRLITDSSHPGTKGT
ncbi:NAD(P)/FAD-dependent oxidoreductase [Novosphingobium sp.]|uniref:NAD(P)/FAD-dependent oxidoreductase n=1 Tax=Novosphingobium sp. TaxID=1874826 RepID=UPI0025E8F88D|nr:NAD(P)/FAD-dependent oxidoreductase [Novosphingobium sp.]